MVQLMIRGTGGGRLLNSILRPMGFRIHRTRYLQSPELSPVVDYRDDVDWALEREYWHGVLARHCRDRYGVELDPLQSDESLVPPPDLSGLIYDPGHSDTDRFFAIGYTNAMAYLEELEDHGFDPTRMERILEMGVGYGRLIVHYLPFGAELHGCDITPEPLAWTREKLGGRVAVAETRPEPPLPYPDDHFDYVYANSVFTHIPFADFEAWVEELHRVIRPGGCAVISFFAPNVHLRAVAPRELHAKFDAPGYYEWHPDRGVLRGTYVSRRTLHQVWGKRFRVLELRSHNRSQAHLILKKE